MSTTVAFGNLEITGAAPAANTPSAPEPPKDLAQVNPDAFTGGGGLQIWKGTAAGIDKDGVYRTALGHEASEHHRNVAMVWQDRCVPLGEFFSNVVTNDLGKVDAPVPNKAISFAAGTAGTQGNGLYMQHDTGTNVETYKLTPEALRDVARFSGVHMEVVKHFQGTERTEVAAAELSMGWAKRLDSMGGPDNTRTVRLRRDRALDSDGDMVARAVLSPGYDERLDNTRAMSLIMEGLPTKDIDHVLCSHLREDGDALIGNLLLPDTMKDYPDGQYGVGLAFGNDEIGGGSFWVDPFVFQAICVNGNIWSRQNSKLNVRQRHAHLDFEELLKMTGLAIENALSGGHKLIELMQRAREVKVEAATAGNLIAYLGQQERLSKQAANAWYLAFQHEPEQDNALGVVNGLTKAAQEFTGQNRKDLEATAMNILAPSLEADLRTIVGRWERFEGAAAELAEDEVRRYVTVLA